MMKKKKNSQQKERTKEKRTKEKEKERERIATNKQKNFDEKKKAIVMTTTITREQIEFASQNLSSRDQSAREQSEQILLSFRKSPEALRVCRDILENPQSNDTKFQASNALRFAILQNGTR